MAKQLAGIKKRIPSGHKLPDLFEALLAVDMPYDIGWTNLKDYSIKPSGGKELVPFLTTGDGGLIAFWYHAKAVPIVHVGGHGELQVVAVDFENFLKAFNTRTTGVPDLDEVDEYTDERVHIEGVKGKPKRGNLAALQKQFDKWFELHTSLLKPIDSPEADDLRKRLVALARKHGHKDDFSNDYIVKVQPGGLVVTMAYGKQRRVPDMEPLVAELITYAKNKRKAEYRLTVTLGTKFPFVSLDSDRELLLVDPDDPD